MPWNWLHLELAPWPTLANKVAQKHSLHRMTNFHITSHGSENIAHHCFHTRLRKKASWVCIFSQSCLLSLHKNPLQDDANYLGINPVMFYLSAFLLNSRLGWLINFLSHFEETLIPVWCRFLQMSNLRTHTHMHAHTHSHLRTTFTHAHHTLILPGMAQDAPFIQSKIDAYTGNNELQIHT